MRQHIKKYNRYDIFIIILIAALAGGEIGGALQITRAVGIVLLPFMLKLMVRRNNNILKRPLSFALFIISWCTLSLLWTGNVERGFQELIYFVVHFAVFMEIIVFSWYSNSRLKSIPLGWALAVLFTAVVAIWEYTTGQHLNYGRYEGDLVMQSGFVRRFLAVTFFNFNDYEVFLCYSIPFLLIGIIEKRRFSELLLYFGVLLVAVVIVLFNASRGASLAVIILGTIGLLRVVKQKGSKERMIMLFMVSVFILIIIYNIDYIIVNLMGRMETSSLFESGRTSIWSLALKCLINTSFLGTGVAGIEVGMSQVSNFYLAPHNMFVEVLVEFGVIVFSLFLYKLLKLLIITYKSHYAYKNIIYATFLVLPFVAIVSSKYLLCVDLFVFFGSLYVVVNNEKYPQSVH